jgi:hypothetical protein
MVAKISSLMTSKNPSQGDFVKGSAVLWRGPSAIDGAEIVVIVTGMPSRKVTAKSTGRSSNRKVGKMAQIWIFRSDMSPLAATMSGADETVCGSCTLRPVLAKLAGNPTTGPRKKVCYLTMQLRAGRGPSTVFKSYRNGRYRDAEEADITAIERGAVRWGAYGDPLAIPTSVLQNHPLLSRLVKMPKKTGYTHRWSLLDAETREWAKTWLMASCETEAQAISAQKRGWRTFRSRKPGQRMLKTERSCPASKESGAKITCLECRQCDGTERGARRPSFSLHLH